MTEKQNRQWPDQTQPGQPLHPERDGNHVIILNDSGLHEVARWTAATREWALPGATLPKSAEWAAKFCGYISPVRTNADLRAAYDRGMKDGWDAAAEKIAAAEEKALRNAERLRQAEILAARRQGAKEMRMLAAEIAIATDETRPANHLGTFYETNALDKWHRRLYATAIQDLPLPGDEEALSTTHG